MDFAVMLTEEQKSQIRTDYRMNHSITITAELNDVHKDVVKQVCGIKADDIARYTYNQKVKIVKEYIHSCENNLNLGTAIAVKYGISKSSLVSWKCSYINGTLKKPRKKNKNSTKTLRTKVVEEWNRMDGTISKAEFCRRKKISYRTLFLWRKEYDESKVSV